MSKTEIERVKITFSRFCTRLLRDYHTPKSYRRFMLMKELDNVVNLLIKLNADKKSYHYVNKCYVLTMRKLS